MADFDPTLQVFLQKPDGTLVWVAEFSAVQEALFLPTNALDLPFGPVPDPPPPGRCRIFVDAVGLVSKQSSTGVVTPVSPDRFPCFLRTVSADFTIENDETCIGKNLVFDPGVAITINGTGELHLL